MSQATAFAPPTGKHVPVVPSRPPISAVRGMLIWGLAIVSILTLWLVLYALVLSSLVAARSQAVLYHQIREQLALQTAPLGGAIPPGTPVALISAPALGIEDLVVTEGTAAGDLMSGPGHRRDTVLPGQPGVSVIYGRSRLVGGPFAGISGALPASTVTVTTGQGVFTYEVIGVRRTGQALPPALEAGKGRLTLVTSDTGSWGGLAPSGALYVDAALTGDAQPSPGRSVAVVPVAETAMKSDASSLLQLTLAVPILLAALIFVVWSWSRWGRWQTWIVGVPLVMAGLWAISGPLLALLPNLL